MKRITTLFLFLFVAGCNDFLETGAPTNQLVTGSVFTNDQTASSAVLGIYESIMSNNFSVFNGQLTLYGGLYADEFLNTSAKTDQEAFYGNALSPANTEVKRTFWDLCYKYIYMANAIIEGLDGQSGVTAGARKQLEGEAKFIRAFSHFYLVSLFGDVPYVTKTDYRINGVISREPVESVFEKIIEDLVAAQSLLPEDLVANGKARPNKFVVAAFLSRVYLYNQEWEKAEAQSSFLIESSHYSLEPELNDVFLKDSRETIWHLIPLTPGQNTNEGNRFAQTSAVPGYIDLTQELLSSFEAGDLRRQYWVNTYSASGSIYSVPFKYKIRSGSPVTEYYVVLRLAEQYLIRAEARARQNNVQDALADVDVVRQRAGLAPMEDINPAISLQGLLDAIMKERRSELFAEWGHRWLDLKRTDLANEVMGVVKGDAWQVTDLLFPLPQQELLSNPNLEPQNPGY